MRYIVVLTFALVSTLEADVLLTDAFNGSQLDDSKWNTFTSPSTPAGTSGSVSVGNDVVTLAHRGTLITKQDFLGGVDIVGRFRIDGPTERFMVWTRTTGASTNPWVDQDNGVYFLFQQETYGDTSNHWLGIGEWSVGGLNDPTGSYTSDQNCFNSEIATKHNLFIPSNEWIDFRVTDDGYSVALYLNDLLTPALTAASLFTAGNHISFNNGYGPGNAVSIDSIIVNSVPEPSALSLLAVGLGVLFRRSRKRD